MKDASKAAKWTYESSSQRQLRQTGRQAERRQGSGVGSGKCGEKVQGGEKVEEEG